MAAQKCHRSYSGSEVKPDGNLAASMTQGDSGVFFFLHVTPLFARENVSHSVSR